MTVTVTVLLRVFAVINRLRFRQKNCEGTNSEEKDSNVSGRFYGYDFDVRICYFMWCDCVET